MKLQCPRCTETLLFDPAQSGKQIRCQWCHGQIRMPAISELPAEEQAEYWHEVDAARLKQEQKASRKRKKAEDRARKAERRAEVIRQRDRPPPPVQPIARLAACPDCGHPMSRQAVACPGCGWVSPVGIARGAPGQALPALASFFVPGLGQLIQGRILAAILFFFGAVLAGVLVPVCIGAILAGAVIPGCLGLILLPVIWIGSILDAAQYVPPEYR